MSLLRPTFNVISLGLLAAFHGVPAFAGDIKVTPAGTTAVKGRHETRKAARKKEQPRMFRRKITTYSLMANPLFKRNDAATAKKGLYAAAVGTGYTGLGSGATIVAKPAVAVPSAALSGLQASSASTGELAFGCADKSIGPVPRAVSACYVHKLDKAWKTQTYVTKGLADSSQGWGGGLAVGYAY